MNLNKENLGTLLSGSIASGVSMTLLYPLTNIKT